MGLIKEAILDKAYEYAQDIAEEDYARGFDDLTERQQISIWAVAESRAIKELEARQRLMQPIWGDQGDDVFGNGGEREMTPEEKSYICDTRRD